MVPAPETGGRPHDSTDSLDDLRDNIYEGFQPSRAERELEYQGALTWSIKWVRTSSRLPEVQGG